MAEFPIMPFYVDAYMADTTAMTTMEHGAYLLLLFAMWRAGGGIPGDDRSIARYAKLTSAQWQRIKPTIMRLCRIESGMLTQTKLLECHEAVRRKSNRNADSARARWLKTKGLPSAFAMRTQSKGNAIQIRKITTTEQEAEPQKEKAPTNVASREAVPLVASPELAAKLSAPKRVAPAEPTPVSEYPEMPDFLVRAAVPTPPPRNTA